MTSETPVADIQLPVWDAFVSKLSTLPTELLARLPEEMRQDPQTQQELLRLALQAVAMSSVQTLGADPDYPRFLPGIGEVMNVGQPNADTIYRMSAVEDKGSYRLRGNKGSLNMAVIGQNRPTPADTGKKGYNVDPTRNYLELRTLQADADGNFELLLSPERPQGYEGNWWQLLPGTRGLMLRQVSSDWQHEIDPVLSIERLDQPASRPRPSTQQMEQSLLRLPHAANFMAGMFVDKVSRLIDNGVVNKVELFDPNQGGLLDGQFYYEGAYQLASDEALVIEAKHPEQCEYRSLILTNHLYQTTDWINNHSSLNGSQAGVDSDGVLRIVVSEQDPGVANWLHTAGYPIGAIQGRWTNCSSQPIPSVTKLKIDEVVDYLPKDTALVTAAEREQIVRERRHAFQQRRHW